MVQGGSKQRPDKFTVEPAAGRAALGAAALGACAGRVGQTSLQRGLQFQDLHGVVFIVLVAGLDDGTSPLCILNQTVPMLIVLEIKKRERQLHPNAHSHA